ncbi:UNVERIFIED_CONTAM: hypothetical protein HDU68_002655 [Siphonaria sp. JEL0065]|nr:hypothetical protein HDU68_002655 [Siphonaria sp. JEL0065]
MPISKHSSKPYLRTLLALNTAPSLTASKLRTSSTLPPFQTSDTQFQNRTKILRATIAIQRWFRAKQWKKKPQKGFKQSPESDVAASIIQQWFRPKVLKWRLARLASTAKIVKILKSVESIMSHLLVDGSGDRANILVLEAFPLLNANTNCILGTCDIPNLSSSIAGSVSSGYIGGGLYVDYRESDEVLSMAGFSDSDSHTSSPQPFSRRIPSNSHITTFSPISSPRLLPTIVQVQSNISALHNLVSEVKNVRSTSPRIKKMKQSTVSLIERYIECVLHRNLEYHFAQHQLDTLHIAATSSASNSVYAPSNNGHHEGTLSSNGNMTNSKDGMGGGGAFHIDKLIVIRRMEYALMQSIYGLGHGSSSDAEVITCNHEGFPVNRYSSLTSNNYSCKNGNRFSHTSNASEDAAADYILSDFYDAVGLGQGFGNGRGPGIRSREYSTAASMCEIAITDSDSEVSHDERVCRCAASSQRGMVCKRGSGLDICRNIVNPMAGVNDENAMDHTYSEGGSDVWEIV